MADGPSPDCFGCLRVGPSWAEETLPAYSALRIPGSGVECETFTDALIWKLQGHSIANEEGRYMLFHAKNVARHV